MNEQILKIIERMLKAKNASLVSIKQSPKKFLKVPQYISQDPEYIVLHEVKKLQDAYFVIAEGDRDNKYSAVFVVINGFVFELDEYSFEALGMNEALSNYFYEITNNLSFDFG